MKEVTYFYLADCPFCNAADRMLEELTAENPEFSKISLKKIEERENPALANRYDYFYVPCLWIDKKSCMRELPQNKNCASFWKKRSRIRNTAK